ncbi:MAG: cytochrome c biogenesis protein DipZ, partial [Patescibacteria group bacterium]|nr:cytochrome c biogenesis protein DipZ [Patescibacteria group bacterium]
CILPILPIVLSGSVGGGKRKPLGIIVGFILSFTFFTLFLTTLVRFTGIPSDTLRIVAACILILFGISLFTPKFQVVMELMFTKLSAFSPKATSHAGFAGGLVIGLTIGIIWAPCVGPIMASVIALASTSTITTQTFFITLSYAIGTGIPMFFIMIGGRNLLSKVPALLSNTGNIQKGFGIIMVLFAIAIFFHWDTNFEALIANSQYGLNLTNIENNQAVKNSLNTLKGNSINNTNTLDTNGLFNANTPAPDFVGITHWLNIDKPLSIHDLKGKVVLVDFWTYTCINCIRTLPFVTSWYNKYKDQGFVVIGVHTPEFQFEHETTNVAQAINTYKIAYPVAQDNNYATWNNYSNEYWPAEYLIDSNGIVRRTHFGEGEYDQMEKAIQALLQEAGKKVSTSIESMSDQTPVGQLSPETYLGSGRMQFFYPLGSLSTGTQTFTLSENIPLNSFSYGGEWTIAQEYATAGKNATLNYHFLADKVYIILRPNAAGQNQTVKVYLDGKVINPSVAGADVQNGIITVDSDRLYNIVDLHGKIETHTLELEFLTPGVQAFTFTFG